MAKISVCLPVFNGERYLAAAIESVLAQTEADFELIIQDDRSTDSSAQIVRQYAAKDLRIKFGINKTNLGLFENYNKCLQIAQGEYIKPFAQDDVLAIEMLEKQLAVLQNDPSINLVSTARNWLSDTGCATKEIRPFSDSRLISGREVILYNLAQLNNWVGEPSTVMFRRCDIGDGFDTRFYHYGDIDYWFRIVENGNYYFLNEVLCGFRRHDESTSASNLRGMFFALDVMLLGKKYRKYSEQLGESEDHFVRRALEVIALNVNHLVQTEDLTAEQSVALQKRSSTEEAQAFREVLFHSLQYTTKLIAENDALQSQAFHERKRLLAELDDMRQSTSWRLTAPLRQIVSGR